jgi:sugar phosphate isomerase/epimerase
VSERLALPLALSSLGLPGASLEEIIAVALDGDCQGLELRAYEGESLHVGLSERERADVSEAVAAAGLVISTVASYVEIAAPGDDQEVCESLRAHVALARDLGAPAVRVFPGGDPDDVPASDARARTRLKAVADDAAAAGVHVLLETHDSHPRAEDAARILPGTGAGAIWDPLHSWRAGEPLRRSAELLGPWLVEVQIKDANGLDDTTPALPGTGALPLDALAEVLHEVAFEGWLCLEWERAWYPQVPPASEALAATNAWLAANEIARAPVAS